MYIPAAIGWFTDYSNLPQQLQYLENETAIWPHVYRMDAPKMCIHYDHQPPKAIPLFSFLFLFIYVMYFPALPSAPLTFFLILFLAHWT